MEIKPDVEVTIRPYTEDDQPGVVWLFARTPPWGRTYPRPQPPPDDIEPMSPEFRFRLVATEIDRAGEAVIGFAAVAPALPAEEELPDFVPDAAGAARLRWMSVAPERWRLGIGRRLVQACIEWARTEGYEAMVLETTVQQRGAIALYESAGFREIGQYLLNGVWQQVFFWKDL